MIVATLAGIVIGLSCFTFTLEWKTRKLLGQTQRLMFQTLGQRRNSANHFHAANYLLGMYDPYAARNLSVSHEEGNALVLDLTIEELRLLLPGDEQQVFDDVEMLIGKVTADG